MHSGGRRIAIHDADAAHFRRGKTFPNYALMKIAAYHKAQGDAVEWWDGPLANKYDQVYSAKVFDFTPADQYLPADTIKGGTGYDVKSALPAEVDAMFPDYSIYPACNYAIGFTTRGCIRRCRWCVVPEKEGAIRPYRTWQELARPDSKKLVLMDNNILACAHGIEQLAGLTGRQCAIDVNQGMDARLVTPEIAEILARVWWIKFIRFSCDSIGQIEPLQRAAELLAHEGVKPWKIFIYLLVTADIEDAAYRVDQIKRIGPVTIYAQAERNARAGISPNKMQLEFCQRYIYGGSFRSETWAKYCQRKGFGEAR